MVLDMSRQVGRGPSVGVSTSQPGEGVLFKMRGEMATAQIGPTSFAHLSSGVRLCENPTYFDSGKVGERSGGRGDRACSRS